MSLDLPPEIQKSIDKQGILFAFDLSRAFRAAHAPFVGWKRKYDQAGAHVCYEWVGEGPMDVPLQYFLNLTPGQIATASADPLGMTELTSEPGQEIVCVELTSESVKVCPCGGVAWFHTWDCKEPQ